MPDDEYDALSKAWYDAGSRVFSRHGFDNVPRTLEIIAYAKSK